MILSAVAKIFQLQAQDNSVFRVFVLSFRNCMLCKAIRHLIFFYCLALNLRNILYQQGHPMVRREEYLFGRPKIA